MPMCWGKEIGASRQLVRLAVVLALAALTGACFQPLYGNQTITAGDSVRDKLGAIQIPDIPAPKGTPTARLAVALRSSLMADLNGGATPISPLYRLDIKITGAGSSSVIVDVTSGRPDSELEAVNATFSLTEIATNKVVLGDSTFARASYDIPGSEQRFARQRAGRNAEDRAVELLAQNIRNRLASFFVAGT
jgi:LPS-assembly lipoprotein